MGDPSQRTHGGGAGGGAHRGRRLGFRQGGPELGALGRRLEPAAEGGGRLGGAVQGRQGAAEAVEALRPVRPELDRPGRVDRLRLEGSVARPAAPSRTAAAAPTASSGRPSAR